MAYVPIRADAVEGACVGLREGPVAVRPRRARYAVGLSSAFATLTPTLLAGGNGAVSDWLGAALNPRRRAGARSSPAAAVAFRALTPSARFVSGARVEGALIASVEGALIAAVVTA